METKEAALAVINLVRSEVYLELRFMDVALSALEWKPDDSMPTFGTDGKYMFYNEERITDIFPKNPKYLDRAYLHTVLHCVFSHLWIQGEREKWYWHIACDVMVEYTIDYMGKPKLSRPITLLRKQVYELINRSGDGVSAAVIYRLLKDSDFERDDLLREFFVDFHKYWPEKSDKHLSKSSREMQNKWDTISRQTQIRMKSHGMRQSLGMKVINARIRSARSRRSYREFLKKFSVTREELQTDPDEFDLGYYTYGLNLYGNMPLIEYMESKEVKKIRDFVIVIDTSISTKGELVEGFLRETFTLLQERDSFFSKTRIHIIQCDSEVRRDDVVNSPGELNKLLDDYELEGGGGTDFRPAFDYVERLKSIGQLDDLQGLIYFTDGKGIFPGKRPSFDTAFIFLRDYNESVVPPWAMCLLIEEEEILPQS